MIGFSVIIPTRNRPGELAACLKSFRMLDFPPGDWELIVVNDGGDYSFSAVSEKARSCLPLKLLEISRTGPAAARNRGAAVAKYEFLAFTDDDCRVTPGWLREFADGFVQTGFHALGGSSLNPQPENRAMRASQFLIDFMYSYLRDGGDNSLMLVSNNAAYRRKAFTAVGGFDESFPFAAGEDMELGYRLVAHGFRQCYWPAAQVWHHHKLNAWGHIRQQFRYGRGGHYFFEAVARQARKGVYLQPRSATNYYVALGQALRQQKASLALGTLVAVAQAAYRLGQFYERQLCRFTRPLSI